MYRQIKKIVPINLKRRQDKLILYYGAMQSWGVKPDEIFPFEAHDAQDYGSVYDIRDAAKGDLPFWNKLKDNWFDEWAQKGTLCCMWSMQSVLKQISEDDDKDTLTMMMTDHYCLRRLIWDIQSCVNKVGDYDIMQMHHWQGNFRKGNHPPTFPTPFYDFPEISDGLAGAGDTVLLLNPVGAGRILEWWSDMPYHLLEILLYHKSFESPENCRSTIVPTNWVFGPLPIEHLTGNPDSERLTNV